MCLILSALYTFVLLFLLSGEMVYSCSVVTGSWLSRYKTRSILFLFFLVLVFPDRLYMSPCCFCFKEIEQNRFFGDSVIKI